MPPCGGTRGRGPAGPQHLRDQPPLSSHQRWTQSECPQPQRASGPATLASGRDHLRLHCPRSCRVGKLTSGCRWGLSKSHVSRKATPRPRVLYAPRSGLQGFSLLGAPLGPSLSADGASSFTLVFRVPPLRRTPPRSSRDRGFLHCRPGRPGLSNPKNKPQTHAHLLRGQRHNP